MTTELPLAGQSQGGGCGCGGCGCGGGSAIPLLEAHAIPKKIRIGAILGSLSILESGEQMDLVGPRHPEHIQAQVEEVFPGEFAAEVVEEGERPTIRFTRA